MISRNKELDVVLFCGGRGTRLSEKTKEMPKPLIELGEYPILWHIMKAYSYYHHNRFLFTLGYKGEMIVDFFVNQYRTLQNFSIQTTDITLPDPPESWDLSFIRTGLETKTANRLLMCRESIQSGTFMATYGDGVADIQIDELIKTHDRLKNEEGIIATITLTKPYSKYGIVKLNGKKVESFREKPQMDEYINVGFMVLEPEVFEYISPEKDEMFEDTLQRIAEDGKLGYYIHDGFWHAMDSYKDYVELNEIWKVNPKWKIWKE